MRRVVVVVVEVLRSLDDGESREACLDWSSGLDEDGRGELAQDIYGLGIPFLI